MIAYLFISIVLFLLVHLIHSWNSRRKMPPGPMPLPLIGNLLTLAAYSNPLDAFLDLRKKYGSCFTLQMGTVTTVIVTTYQDIKSVALNDDFCERLNKEWILDRNRGKEIGLLFSEFGHWKSLRKFVVTNLKQYGSENRKIIESLIHAELNEMFEQLKTSAEANNGKLKLANPFSSAFVNVIWTLLTGERYETNDHKFQNLIHLSEQFINSGKYASNILAAFPWLKNVAPKLCGFETQRQINQELWNYFEGVVKSYRAKGTYKNDPRSFIEGYLCEIEKEAHENSTSREPFSEEALIATINDIFLAGSETSSAAMAMLVRRLVQHSSIQHKIRKEIEEFVGYNRPVSLTDSKNMKYTNATILESLRHMGPAPIGPRRAIRTTRLNGYELPKDTMVQLFFHGAHHDELVWKNPQNFEPERFLDEKNELINERNLISFSLGKRNCMGAFLAQSSLFLALTTLVQRFHIEHDPDYGIPNNGIQIGFTTSPTPYNAILKPISMHSKNIFEM